MLVVTEAMNSESANKFISALVKALQTLCHGYVEFNDGIEIIGHIYLNIDSGSSFDYVVKEKLCKNAENSTVFVSKSFQALAPSDECLPRKDRDEDHSAFEDASMSPTSGTSRLQSAITSISNVLSAAHESIKPRILEHSSHHSSLQNTGKRKKEHNGNYSSMQPPLKYTTLQTSSSSSSSSVYFGSGQASKHAADRNHAEHFSNASHAEFFGADSNHGPDDEDDLHLDVTFVKEEYESQRNSAQRGVSVSAASRLNQDMSSNSSNMLHDGTSGSGTLGYASSHHQLPQQFASGTAGNMGGLNPAFQDTSQVDMDQHGEPRPPNPRNKTEDDHPTFQVPAVPVKYFRCPVCNIIIRHKNNIKRHMRRHNDPATVGNVDVNKSWSQHFVTAPAGTQFPGGRQVRSYNCPICGLLISHRKNVRRHMRKHTGEMFFCDLCEWRGTCRWKLQKHREKKHGIMPIVV